MKKKTALILITSVICASAVAIAATVISGKARKARTESQPEWYLKHSKEDAMIDSSKVDLLSYDRTASDISAETSELLNSIYSSDLASFLFADSCGVKGADQWYDSFRSQIKEIAELEKREDSARALLYDYLESKAGYPEGPGGELSAYSSYSEYLAAVIMEEKFVFTKLMLTRDVFFEQLTEEEKALLETEEAQKALSYKTGPSEIIELILSHYGIDPDHPDGFSVTAG